MNKIISYEEKDGYGILLINRANKRNAISTEMAADLLQLFQEIKERPIRFLLIKSAGNNVFCAGGDLNDFHSDLNEQEAYEMLSTMKQVLFQIVAFPVPTICLLQGQALGGGCELATACDIRIAKENTRFGFVQASLGILPGWGGGALLYEKVHPSFAFTWITEAEVYNAEKLRQKGWLHHIIAEEDWENEEEILLKYTSKSVKQMQHLKSQYIESMSLPTLFEKMEKESSRSANLWSSDEHQAKVQSFLSKNK